MSLPAPNATVAEVITFFSTTPATTAHNLLSLTPASLLSYATALLSTSPSPHITTQHLKTLGEQISSINTALTNHIAANLQSLSTPTAVLPPSSFPAVHSLASATTSLNALAARTLTTTTDLRESLELQVNTLENLLNVTSLLKIVLQVRYTYDKLTAALPPTTTGAAKPPPNLTIHTISPLVPPLATLHNLFTAHPALLTIPVLLPIHDHTRTLLATITSRINTITTTALQTLPNPTLPPLIHVVNTLPLQDSVCGIKKWVDGIIAQEAVAVDAVLAAFFDPNTLTHLVNNDSGDNQQYDTFDGVDNIAASNETGTSDSENKTAIRNNIDKVWKTIGTAVIKVVNVEVVVRRRREGGVSLFDKCEGVGERCVELLLKRLKDKVKDCDPNAAPLIYSPFRQSGCLWMERVREEIEVVKREGGGNKQTLGSIGTVDTLMKDFGGKVEMNGWEWTVPKEKVLETIEPMTVLFKECATKRLNKFVDLMFPEKREEDVLPSKFDVKALGKAYRMELGEAEPRDGGGELGMVPLIAEVIGQNVSSLTQRALQCVNQKKPVFTADWNATENLKHNLNLLALLGQMRTSLVSAADDVFIAPYHPAVDAARYNAAEVCRELLKRLAIDRIDRLIKQGVCDVIVEAACEKITDYLSGGANVVTVEEMLGLVKSKLIGQIGGQEARVYCLERITLYMVRFFVSMVCLKRDTDNVLDHLRDIGDFELGLGSFFPDFETQNEECAKGYRELRALKALIAWPKWDKGVGGNTAVELRAEAFCADLRTSSLAHFLFNFADSLLSSPHHVGNKGVGEYAASLQGIEGEAVAKEGVGVCCEKWRERGGERKEVVACVKRIAGLF